MVSKLTDLISGEALAAWLLAAFLLAYFVYKEWPEFKKRVSSGAVKEQEGKTSERRMEEIEKSIGGINEKLDRDFQRINRLEIEVRQTESTQDDMSEELEIIMKALLATLGGLQELGANGPTKEATDEIKDYLIRKAHSQGGKE